MKYICITKYIHCFTINKYTRKFLDNKTYNWRLVKTIVNNRHQPECHHSEPYLGKSEESNNQGIKVQVKRAFKSYSFCHDKKGETGSA